MPSLVAYMPSLCDSSEIETTFYQAHDIAIISEECIIYFLAFPYMMIYFLMVFYNIKSKQSYRYDYIINI